MKAKSSKGKTMMFFILMLEMIVTSMTTTAISNALPVIMSDMNIGAGTAQWLTSGFTLAAGIMIPATAFLIRRYLNKNIFLGAMILYGAGSLLAAVSPGFVPLLAGRVLQGCGCGILMSFVQVVILAMYPKEKHGLSEEERVHGSAIMATLRQIAGEVGSAMGVAVMTMVASRFASLGQPEAGFRGIAASYICLFVISMIGLAVAVTNVKKSANS